MRITFYSNFLSHHQLPLCLAMDRLTNGQFTFVATTPVPQERLRMGYHDMNKQYPFVLTVFDSTENEQLAQALAMESDVVIIGSASDQYIVKRLKQNKLTFKYSERLYKQGLSFKRIPRAMISAWLHHGRFMRRPLYMLCASAYTAADCAKFGNYVGKTYKWGYFPEVKRQDIDVLIERKRNNPRVTILWVARMIGLKHPDDVILLAKKLKHQGYDFEINLIGNGEMKEQLIHLGIDESRILCVDAFPAPNKVLTECIEYYKNKG